MKPCAVIFLSIVPAAAVFAADGGTPSKLAIEFAKRWDRTRKLAVGVAEAMPQSQYAFRPDPPCMTFGEQIPNLAQANYAFC